MTSITSLGLGPGLDSEALIGQLAAEGTPEQMRISQQKAEYQAELSALGSFRGALDTLNGVLDALADLATFSKGIARSGNTARFTVGANENAVAAAHVEATKAAIDNFVTAYDTLQATLAGLTAYDPATKVAGPLLGDSMMLMFEDQLRREVSDAVSGVSGVFDSLFDIGITTTFENGTLEVDEDVLSEALEENFDDVCQLFASEDGYVVRLRALAESYLEADGLIDVRTEGIQQSLEGLAEDQAQLAAYENRLCDQFTALDQLVAELTSTSEFLAQQLALLPTFDATGS